MISQLRPINKIQLMVQEEQKDGKGKYSLKKRKFTQSIHCSVAQNNSLESNVVSQDNFSSFMAKHNNGLIQMKTQADHRPQQPSIIFNCFDGAHQILNSEILVSKAPIIHRQSNQTRSNSDKQSPQFMAKQSRQSSHQSQCFKINTKSIQKDLFKDTHLNPQHLDTNLILTHEDEFPNLNFEGMKKKKNKEIKFSHFQSQRNHKKKLSLRNQIITKNYNTPLKESLNYKQLADPLNIGSSLQSSKSSPKSIKAHGTHSQFIIQHKIQSDCQCRPKCKWIHKWLSFIGPEFTLRMRSPKIQDKQFKQINKDIPRTQSDNVLFSTAFYQNHLRDLLITYCRSSPDIGYVQGMNIIASGIIYHTKNFSQSLSIFNLIMKQKQFQKIYEGNLELGSQLSQHLINQIKRYSPSYYTYMINADIDIPLFIKSWYFSMLGSFIPLKMFHLVIDKFIRKGFKGLNQFLLTLFLLFKEQFMQTEPQELVVKFSNSWLIKRSTQINWYQLIACSENIMLRPLHC